MFALPMACLVLFVLGQAPAQESGAGFDTLKMKATRAVLKGDVSDVSGMINAVEKEIGNANNQNRKEELKAILGDLNYLKKNSFNGKFNYEKTKGEIDYSLIHALNDLSLVMEGGKIRYLAFREEILQKLAKPRTPHPINKALEFILQMALQDINRLAEIDKDPAGRIKTDKIFNLFTRNQKVQGVPPDAPDQTGLLKSLREGKAEVARLFGPKSHFHFILMQPTLNVLNYECRWGRMVNVDLLSECEKEFAPFSQSEWTDIFLLKLLHLKTKAHAYLCAKSRNHQKLVGVLQEIEEITSNYRPLYGSHSFDTLPFQMAMFTQQGRHQECIQKFAEFKLEVLQANPLDGAGLLLDIHWSAAQSYAGLNKIDVSILHHELAFAITRQMQEPTHFLVDFQKSIAQDLRDKYAQNNRMKEARNLEERCQLLGLGFDPLPKQPGE